MNEVISDKAEIGRESIGSKLYACQIYVVGGFPVICHSHEELMVLSESLYRVDLRRVIDGFCAI